MSVRSAAKKHTRFLCAQCGHETSKWMGRCPSCGEWNAMAEQVPASSRGRRTPGRAAVPLSLNGIRAASDPVRYQSGIGEFDRVLGGGAVEGELILIGGDPGIGKSTLLLQAAAAYGNQRKVLYVSAEESASQIRLRADRLELKEKDFLVLNETDFQVVRDTLEKEMPAIAVIDSIQTMYHPDLPGGAGSVGQIREITSALLDLAKKKDITVFIVGHITKEGTLAGPKLLEHMVDCVLYFEGDRHSFFRVLRAVKNRFGSTDEIGVFEMKAQGLAEIGNPSAWFLTQREKNSPGSALAVVMEGTRPLLIEVQALSVLTGMVMPRRVATGMDMNRLSLLVAVLEKSVGLNFRNQEVYLKMAGGLIVREPAADLASVMALVSSFRNAPVPEGMIFIGEVGLNGRTLPVPMMAARLKEADRMGFTKAVMPSAGSDPECPKRIKPVRVPDLRQAVKVVWNNG